MAGFRRRLYIVSRAWYPAQVDCCVSVSKTAQLRRSLVLFLCSFSSLFPLRVPRQHTLTQPKHVNAISIARQQVAWLEQPAPETPMPEAPLIRVLETYDLSSTNVEHFLDSKADLKALIPNSVAGTLSEHTPR